MSEVFHSINTLGKELETIVGVNQVLREFPRPDQGLNLPSISLTTVNAPIAPRIPMIARRTVEGDNVRVLYSVGEYNISIQLDIWTEYKRQREDIYSKVLAKFDSQLMQTSYGLKLLMPEYYNVIVQYDLNSYKFMDDAQKSMMGEWRMMCDVDCHFERVVEYVLPKIADIEIVETIDNI